MGKTKNPDSKTLNVRLFKGKNVNSLLEDIYDSINSEHKEIKFLMEQITELITGEDADEGMLGFMGPVLSDLLDVSVKNNEQYIKLAEAVQKFLSLDVKNRRIDVRVNDNDDKNDPFSLSDEDKTKLVNIKKQVQNIEGETKEIQKKIDTKNNNRVMN